MLNSDTVCCPAGQRTVAVFMRVEAHAVRPMDVQRPNTERFQPPKLNAIGTGTGTFTPTIPACTSWTNSRAVWPLLVKRRCRCQTRGC